MPEPTESTLPPGSQVEKLKQLHSLQGLTQAEMAKKLLSLEVMKDLQYHQDQMKLLDESRRHQRTLNRWTERRIDAVEDSPEESGDIRIGDTFVLNELLQGGSPQGQNKPKSGLKLLKMAAIAAGLATTGGLGAAGTYLLGQFFSSPAPAGRDTDTQYSIEVLPPGGEVFK